MADTVAPQDEQTPDVAAARAAGYSDAEIADYLGAHFGADVSAARNAGYSDAAILDFLAPPKAAEPPPPAKPPEISPLTATARAAGQGVVSTTGSTIAGAGVALQGAGADLQDAPVQRRLLDTFRQIDQGADLPDLFKGIGDDLVQKGQIGQYFSASPEERAQIKQDLLNSIANPTTQQIGASTQHVGEQISEAGHNVAEWGQRAMPIPQDMQDKWYVTAGHIAGGLGAYLPAAALGGLPGVIGVAGLSAMDQTFEEAKKAGASTEDAAATAMISGVVQGAGQAVPVSRALGMWRALPNFAAKSQFVHGLMEMAESSATLVGFSQAATLADNVIAKNSYDPNRSLTQGLGENLGPQAAAGAILPVAGMGARLLARPFTGRPEAQPAPEAKPAAPTPEEVGQKVMQTGTVDDAIATARQSVETTPIDIEAEGAKAAESEAGQTFEVQPPPSFEGLNGGSIKGEDGTFFFQPGNGGQEVPLKVWDEKAPQPEGAEPTVSPDLVKRQRELYGKLGIRVVYFENDPAIPFDGAVSPDHPDVIFLSNNPDRNVAQVGAHEVTHVLESTTLPDGTSLADRLHQQLLEGMTSEGWDYANRTFGVTAPDRAAFAPGAEGDAAHADAAVRHLITEVGADMGAEAPKFPDFIGKVIDQVQARYGDEAAKGVLAKLIAGFRNAMQAMREMFVGPEGPTETVSQNWVTNIGEIHDTLAQMKAERFGTQIEKENAKLAAMRERAQAQREQAATPAEPQPAATAEPVPAAPPAAEAAAAPPAEAPAGPSFRDAVDEEMTRSRQADAEARRAGQALPTKQPGQRAFEARMAVFNREAGPDLADLHSRYDISPDDISDLSKIYDRQPGEAPHDAFWRAVDQWAAEEEAAAIRSHDGTDSLLRQDLEEFSRAYASDSLRDRAAGSGRFRPDEPKHQFPAGPSNVTAELGLGEIPFHDTSRGGETVEGRGGAPEGGQAQPAERAPAPEGGESLADSGRNGDRAGAEVAAAERGTEPQGAGPSPAVAPPEVAEAPARVEEAGLGLAGGSTAQRERQQPATTMLQDAGEKIGGARKDMWAERGLRVGDLEGMTEGEAYQNTTKDQVWPKPDYAKMVEDGVDPQAAALIKIVRDRLAARPSVDSAEGRRNYITMMGHVRQALSEVRAPKDMRNARDKLVYDLAGHPRMGAGIPSKEARSLLFSVYKGRSEPFRVSYADERKAQQMVEQGFPGKVEPWTRRFDIHQSTRGDFFVTGKGSRHILAADFTSREEAENFARQSYEKAAGESGGEGVVPKRPHLDSVRRTGADVRAGRDVTGDDFVKDFGFRGVEFGNWVASDERQKVVNLAYDGLHDLANVLHVPVKALSLDGQLALAFGARGRGGAAAHYEPGRLVINMTKLSGSGSLAHEWGHALDHYFGMLDTGANAGGEPRGASGWYARTAQRKSYLKNLRPEMAEAFDQLMTAMFKRDKTRAEAVRGAELQVEDLEGQIAKQRERMAAVKESDPSRAKFLKDSQVWIEKAKMRLDAARRHLADVRDEEKPYIGGKVTSSYYTEANKLSGKSGEKGYWSRPTEMFARAFESYVFDKIKAEGNASQYLVQGVEPERYRGGYKGNPYPDAERPAINAAFDHLFQTMGVREGQRGPALFSPRVPRDTEPRVEGIAVAAQRRWDEAAEKANRFLRNIDLDALPRDPMAALDQFEFAVQFDPRINQDRANLAIARSLWPQLKEANKALYRLDADHPARQGQAEVPPTQERPAQTVNNLAPFRKRQKASLGEGEPKPEPDTLFSPRVPRDTEPRGPALLETPKTTPEELAARQRRTDKDLAEANMRGRKVAGKPQESAEDLPIFGGERQKTLFSPRQTETPEFKRWFGDSKVVDEEGRPLVVYHGTADSVQAFDLGHPNRKDTGWLGTGVYATTNPDIANSYANLKRGAGAPNVMPLYAKLENPYFATLDDKMRLQMISHAKGAEAGREAADEWTARLKAEGHDGVILDFKPDVVGAANVSKEIVVFDPASVKSAIGNRGTFDAKNPDVNFSPRVPRIAGENKDRKYTPAQREAFANVGRTTEPKTFGDLIDTAKQDLGKRILRDVVDPYIGVKERDPSGYMALRNANTTSGAFEVFKRFGTLKFSGSTYDHKDLNGGVVNSLLRPLGKEAGDFIWWVAGHRAERLAAEDRENLMTSDDIEALKELNKGKLDFDYDLGGGHTTRSREMAYMNALRRLDGFNKNALDLAVDSGLLRREDVDAKWSNPFYVPFYRQAEADNSRHFVGPSISDAFVKQTAFKALKGGREKLNADLWENAFGNWAHMIDAALSNQAARRVLETAGEPAAGAATRVSKTAYNLMSKADRAKTVWVMEDGEQAYYKVDDPYLLKAITAMEYTRTPGMLMDIGRGFKTALQMGVTMEPLFQVRNLIRDTQQTVAVSKASANVVKNLVDGFSQVDVPGAWRNVGRAIARRELQEARLTPEAISAMAGGGFMHLSAGTDTGYRGTGVSTYLNTPEKIKAFWNYITTAGHAYVAAAGRGENVNRAALYKQLRDQGVPHDEAAFAARDLADFTLKGAAPVVRAITELVPFMNAWMQGLYKVGRAATDADRNISSATGGVAKRVAFTIATVAALSWALDNIYGDDEDYQNRTEHDRNSNFWFKVGGTEFRIPMGFEVAGLSRMVTNWVEATYDPRMSARRALDNTWEILGTQMSLNPIPQAVKPVLDIARNQSQLGSPIETAGMENLQPEERYRGDTTLAARGVSGVLNKLQRILLGDQSQSLSPVQIDYLARAYGGWLATQSLNLADYAMRSVSTEPSRPNRDLLAFVTGGMASATPTTERLSGRYINMLYDQGKAVERAYATLNNMMKEGRAAEAQDFYNENKDMIAQHGLVSQVMKAEGDINRQIRLIAGAPDSTLSPEQKRLRIMELTATRNRLARQAIEAR